MKIARVFPRKTNASPDDDLAFFGAPDLFVPRDLDEVHISVAFTWDIPRAEWFARQWEGVAPVKIGGPATGMRGEEFVAGRYLKTGHTITSRGCDNRCWFCSVWKRDGSLRELPITDGWIVTDDNLLSCSDAHFDAVIQMLSRQKQKAEFRGGLEAKRLTVRHAEALRSIKPRRLYFAYDTPDDLVPLREAGELLRSAGFTTASHNLCAYVLCGFKGDSFDAAESRMRDTLDAGFTPYAMAYRGNDGRKGDGWAAFQRKWTRPWIIYGTDRRDDE